MHDVARLAGVSQSTVSVVVNNREAEIGISGETSARVTAAIEELGFRPNLAARGLRLQRSRTFGFITDHIASSPFGGRTVLGAQDAAWTADHLLLMVNTNADPALEKTAVEALIDRGVDGLLYAAMSWGEVDLPHSFRLLPTVLVNCWSPEADRLSAVVPCEVRGGRRAAEELIAHGHRDIAFLGGIPTETASVERQVGFRQAMAAAGLVVAERWVLRGNYDISSGYRLATGLYTGSAAGDRPTGVVCGNDRMAAGVLSALSSLGLSVPADVSVVGYDDQEGLADQLTPALTTVSIPHYEMGRVAVEILLAAVTAGAVSPAKTVEVPGQLIRRDSVSGPAGR